MGSEAPTVGVTENFAKFTEKHLYQSLFFNKVAVLSQQLYLKRHSAQVFSCEFFEIFKNTFFLQVSNYEPRTFENENPAH